MVPDASGKNPGGVRGERHRLRGPSRIDVAAPRFPSPLLPKKRVLFVCIGNSCRSQMAEAFAQAYGADIMEVQSAGVSPGHLHRTAHQADAERAESEYRRSFPEGHGLSCAASLSTWLST